MPSISIIGASGAVGTTLAGQILRSNLLRHGDRLQLVARGVKSSAARLMSTRIDLMDAFDDQGVDIEVVAGIEDVDGDIVVVCAAIPPQANLTDRRDLGRANLVLYEQIAETCAQRLPHAWYVIISNPVELAVRIFSDRLGRQRVVGMGAEQDSLRFARAIAHDLGVSRHEVSASVLGEHGQAMIPLWSSVGLSRYNPQLLNALEEMKNQSRVIPLEQRVAELKTHVLQLVQDDLIGEAYEITRKSLPDARIFLQPFITWRMMHSTPNATANAALHFLTAILANSRRPLHGQVLLSGEFLNIQGVCGVPLDINQDGWRIRHLKPFTDDEQSRILLAADSIERYATEISST